MHVERYIMCIIKLNHLLLFSQSDPLTQTFSASQLKDTFNFLTNQLSTIFVVITNVVKRFAIGCSLFRFATICQWAEQICFSILIRKTGIFTLPL